MIRRSAPEDAGALRRLAQLDSARPPAGPHLLALVDGELRAALPLGAGCALADPFQPTAGLLELLRRAAAPPERANLRLRGRRRLAPQPAGALRPTGP